MLGVSLLSFQLLLLYHNQYLYSLQYNIHNSEFITFHDALVSYPLPIHESIKFKGKMTSADHRLFYKPWKNATECEKVGSMLIDL